MSEQLNSSPESGERFKVTPIVYMVFMRGEEILLLKRSTGERSGFWSIPAGHIEEGETAGSAASRELREELGIEVSPASFEFAHLNHMKDRDGHRFIVSMKARDWIGEPRNMEPEKHSEIGWFNVNALPADMTRYARNTVEDIASGRSFREQGFDRNR